MDTLLLLEILHGPKGRKLIQLEKEIAKYQQLFMNERDEYLETRFWNIILELKEKKEQFINDYKCEKSYA